MFDLQPTLVGPRITIRPVKADDWDGMYLAGQDPEIWAVHPAPDRYLEASFRQYFDDGVESGSAFSFVDSESGTKIGGQLRPGDWTRQVGAAPEPYVVFEINKEKFSL